jgi:hypothetical protein
MISCNIFHYQPVKNSFIPIGAYDLLSAPSIGEYVEVDNFWFEVIAVVNLIKSLSGSSEDNYEPGSIDVYVKSYCSKQDAINALPIA